MLVALWAFAEATVFFIVADVAIMAVGLRYGWRKGVVAALIASLFSAMGGLVMMGWAAFDPAGSRAVIEALPGISPALFDEAAQAFRSGGWAAMMEGSFSGAPYKIYAHTAGADGIAPVPFALSSIIARLPRFLLIAALSGAIGPWLTQRLGARLLWVLFIAAWALFYWWFWQAIAA